MGDESVQVIVERIDNLKEHLNSRMDVLDEKIDSKCDSCQNVPTFRERLRAQWYHIQALWAAVTGLAFYFYQHIIK